MSQDGWVKNYRKIEEWQWYTVPNMAHLFQHLIRKANHKDGQWCGVEIKKGQLVCGLPSLSAATGISIRGLRTCLDRLERSCEITRKSTNRFSVITICKYSEYQQDVDAERQASDRQTTGKRQANDNKQECKNEKNERIKEKDICTESQKSVATNLIRIISMKRKLRISPSQEGVWANTIRLMETRDGVAIEQMDKALSWYEKNWMNEYVPVIESACAFREKWAKLLNAIERDKKTIRKDTNNGFDKRDYSQGATKDENIPDFLRG